MNGASPSSSPFWFCALLVALILEFDTDATP